MQRLHWRLRFDPSLTGARTIMSLRRQLTYGATGLAILAAISCGGRSKTPPSPVLDAYLRLQTALAEDAIDRVPADAVALSREAEHLGAAGERIHTAAAKLQAASDIKTMRTTFADVSDAVIAYVRTSHADRGSDLHVVFCPMVEKSWVQQGTAVRNPYFGKGMPECGQVRSGF